MSKVVKIKQERKLEIRKGIPLPSIRSAKSSEYKIILQAKKGDMIFIDEKKYNVASATAAIRKIARENDIEVTVRTLEGGAGVWVI